jgi:hypothetical protein
MDLGERSSFSLSLSLQLSLSWTLELFSACRRSVNFLKNQKLFSPPFYWLQLKPEHVSVSLRNIDRPFSLLAFLGLTSQFIIIIDLSPEA